MRKNGIRLKLIGQISHSQGESCISNWPPSESFCNLVFCSYVTIYKYVYAFLNASPSSQQLALFSLNATWLCVLHVCLCSLPSVYESTHFAIRLQTRVSSCLFAQINLTTQLLATRGWLIWVPHLVCYFFIIPVSVLSVHALHCSYIYTVSGSRASGSVIICLHQLTLPFPQPLISLRSNSSRVWIKLFW